MSKAEQLIDELLDERVKFNLQKAADIAKKFGGTVKELSPVNIKVLFKVPDNLRKFVEFIDARFPRLSFDVQQNTVFIAESKDNQDE